MTANTLSRLNSLLYFSKETLRSLSGDSDSTVSMNIHRWLKSGELVKLKNGVYTTQVAFQVNKNKQGYREFLANILCSPSYVSTEYVLSSYDILTEASYGLTSVTLKTSRSFDNLTASYSYKNIKKDLFTGFERRLFGDAEYLVATKSKALFDYLYYKLPSMSGDLTGRNLTEELRLRLDEFSSADFTQLKSFAKVAQSKKLTATIKNLIHNASY